MKVLILCGGAGTRLKEETEYKPKPMVYVGSKPIIWHIMKQFSFYGLNEFVLALGYKADYIKDFFLNQKAFTSDFTLETTTHKTKFYLSKRQEVDDFKITFVNTGINSLIGERIMRCKDYLTDSDLFIITYGDGVSDVNVKKLIAFHKKQKTIGTITGVHPISKYGLLKVSNTSVVKTFQEKPVLSDWVNGGYMVFDKRIFDYLSPNESEIDAIKKLIAHKQISLYKHEGFWFAVDTYKELEYLNELWKSGKPQWKIWK